MAEAYTSEEFNWARAYVTGHNAQADEIVLAALRIAAAAYKPGVIETAINGCYDPGTIGTAAAIRLALKRGTT